MLEAEGVDVVAGSDVSAEPWDSKKQRVESAPATGSVFPLSAGIEAHVGADSPFFGDALEVPSLVGEGLTQAESPAVLHQPELPFKTADIYGFSGHVTRPVRWRNKLLSGLFTAVLGHCIAEELVLIANAPPTTGDVEDDPLGRGRRGGSAHRIAQPGLQPSHRRDVGVRINDLAVLDDTVLGADGTDDESSAITACRQVCRRRGKPHPCSREQQQQSDQAGHRARDSQGTAAAVGRAAIEPTGEVRSHSSRTPCRVLQQRMPALIRSRYAWPLTVMRCEC